jgi:hypothetical protein
MVARSAEAKVGVRMMLCLSGYWRRPCSCHALAPVSVPKAGKWVGSHFRLICPWTCCVEEIIKLHHDIKFTRTNDTRSEI